MIPLPTVAKIQNYLYDKRDKIGSGGYASVYKAFKDSDPNTPYALKILDIRAKPNQEKLIWNIEREIKLLTNIKNENVIKLLDYFADGEGTKKVYFLFFEFGDEGSLEARLKNSPLKVEFEEKPNAKCSVSYLQEEEVIKIMRQIANGFKYLSNEGIIHRDLKPSNIVFKNSIAKIIDLDFAKYIDFKDTPAIGTYGYKSPEVFIGDYEHLAKCDIWSFGIMIFELLFGRFPWIPQSKCDFQFLKVSKNPIKFPKFPTVSFQMKKILREILVFDYNRRLDWNGVCLRMDELGLGSGEEPGTPKTIKKKSKVDISKYYEFSSSLSEESKNEEFNSKNENKELKSTKNEDINKKIESIKIKLKFASFFGTCYFNMIFNIEQKTIFISNDKNELKNEILDFLNRIAINFVFDAKTDFQDLKKATPDLDELQTLQKKIDDHEFNVAQENKDPPNYRELRHLLKKFLKAHKFIFSKENENFLLYGDQSLLFYKLFCFFLRIIKTRQPFEIFAEKEDDLISQMIDDLLLRYENMKLDNFIKEIREGLRIK